jgi:uncharacterized membrane protein
MAKQLLVISRGVMTNMVIPIPMRAALEKRAAAEKTTLSEIGRRALAEYLDRPSRPRSRRDDGPGAGR